MTRLVAIVVLSAALAGPASPSAAPQAASSYVTVVNQDGLPVTGLGGEDFAMRDGAVRQAVLGADAAIEPLAVVIATIGVPESDGAAVHAAGARLVDRVSAALPASTVRWLPVVTGGDDAADQIERACTQLDGAASDRRVVVVLASRPLAPITHAQADAILAASRRVRAAIWTVEWTPSAPPVDEQNLVDAGVVPLADVFADAAALGGSIRRVIPGLADLPAATSRVADLLLAQYVVTYQWPNPMLGQLTITTRHDRGTVLMPVWR